MVITPGPRSPTLKPLKVFAVDVLACPKCDSRMQRIAWITQPRVIKVILACVEAMPQPA